MLIQRLKVSNLLSFGLEGIDLPLRPLNVLIGPNGSGKSNLLEVLALLRAAPDRLEEPVMAGGGIREWIFKTWAGKLRKTARIEAEVCLSDSESDRAIRHEFEISEDGERFALVGESIGDVKARPDSNGRSSYFLLKAGVATVWDRASAKGSARARSLPQLDRGASILSQIRDPGRYRVFDQLEQRYREIQLHRNWTFGPGADVRRSQRADERSDRINARGSNLANVIAAMPSQARNDLNQHVGQLYEEAQGVHVRTSAGNVQLFLVEKSGVEIPATRLSDGTLRYLTLLTILLDPEPPPLVAIEEPELGLHPDLMPHLAKLMRKAARSMQLVVTTHSRVLVDALGEQPESVVICSKEAGVTRMERLDGERMKNWLERYSLGELWRIGELGGNRW